MAITVKLYHDVSTKALFAWRVINFIMAIFFAIASGVQYNDPDPLIWMLLYGMASIICMTIIINPYVQEGRTWRFFVSLHLLFCVGMLIYAIMAYGNIVKKYANILHDEEGRELGGLTVTSIWISICIATSFSRMMVQTKWLTKNPPGSVHPIGKLSWCIILLCATVPLLGTMLLYVSIDPSTLPHHCKSIIEMFKKYKNGGVTTQASSK